MAEGLSAADAQLGRLAAGLDWSSPDFALLPPHFAHGNGPTVEELRAIFPTYDNYPDSFRPVLPFLVASLVYVSSLPHCA
jgi:hypothetical protein